MVVNGQFPNFDLYRIIPFIIGVLHVASKSIKIVICNNASFRKFSRVNTDGASWLGALQLKTIGIRSCIQQ
jgi:hypothetical protein